MFQLAARALGLEPLRPCLYALRHGGASDDVLTQRRSMLAVKARGRWASDDSLKRYGKATRLLSEVQKMPPATVAYGARIEAALAGIMLGTAAAPPPPASSRHPDFVTEM